jgi:hypothetical protein
MKNEKAVAMLENMYRAFCVEAMIPDVVISDDKKFKKRDVHADRLILIMIKTCREAEESIKEAVRPWQGFGMTLMTKGLREARLFTWSSSVKLLETKGKDFLDSMYLMTTQNGFPGTWIDLYPGTWLKN